MAANNQITKEVVLDVLNRFPDKPTLTLAKKLFHDNPLLFKDIEAARTSVRYYRGERGDHHRKYLKDKSHMGRKVVPAPKLPESAAEPKQTYVLPKANNNILIISDLHIPYHDNEAIECALDYGLAEKVNTIIILGDLLDMHMMSNYQKDPRKRSIKEEFDTCRVVLEYIRYWFPTQKIIYELGNHDIRYEKWLMVKAPEVFDDPYYSMEQRLRLHELKIDCLNHDVLIKAGKLFLHHGHLILGGGLTSPVNSARGVYMRAKQSTLVAHVHNTSEHTEKNLKGEITTCWSIGCLSELQPDYNPFTNKYNHGFAHVKTELNGDFHVRNIRIIAGKII